MDEPQDADFEANHVKKTAGKPYSERHPVPTIGRYRERLDKRADLESDHGREGGDARARTESPEDEGGSAANANIYGAKNRNADPLGFESNGDNQGEDKGEGSGENDGPERSQDGSEAIGNQIDPRARRKALKKRKPAKEREVTDPVTHLPTIVHDFTKDELEAAPESEDPGESGGDKSDSRLRSEKEEVLAGDKASESLYPPPSLKLLETDLGYLYQSALAVGLFTVSIVLAIMLVVSLGLNSWTYDLSIIPTVIILLGSGAGASAACWLVSFWLRKKIGQVLENHVWEASSKQEELARKAAPESAMWLNSLLTSVWPLINPDLFTSIADELEDVMQASLPPKLVRMVAVTDIGQGSVAPRILGARWLPAGAATQSVSVDGKTKSQKKSGPSDREAPDDGNVQEDLDNEKNQSKGDTKQNQEEDQATSEGLEAESGDFVNMEMLLSYRCDDSGIGFRKKAKKAHLHLTFYLTGNIPFPVFVSLRGFLCRVRFRMQLQPDPPFINLMTLSLMGQPKVDIACVPIARKLVSLTDLPLISSFVQSSIDAALSEYVGPRSLTLDLKQMLEGDDFKKNTVARGVVRVNIKRAYDFKEADTGIPIIKESLSDAYVTVGWAKFGKPLWSTRVITKDMNPVWDECAFILVSAEELNAQESLRVQLWDSDRLTADDDLGRIEISLKELMKDMKGSMSKRTDGFISMEGDEKMPGKLDWEVGYFDKVQITQDQLEAQQLKPEIRSIDALKKAVSEEAKRKLRESEGRSSDEEDQQRALGFQDESNDLIAASPPAQDYPSGILSIQIHNITGLSFATYQKDRNSEGDNYEDDSDRKDDLPSSYATIIINSATVYRTRTKPKNSKPFFNAATERFIRSWKDTEVIISVRDMRSYEDDPLLGFVYLPLEEVLKERCQTNDIYPLSGGAGYGKVRVSLMFRSVEMQMPKNLLGWDYGTLELTGVVTSKGLSQELQGHRITVHNTHGKAKIHTPGNDGTWTAKKNRSVRLAVSARYASNITFEFRKNQALQNTTAAFAILWLKDVVDDDEQTVELDVWDGKADIKRAMTNCLDEAGEKLGTISVPLKFYPGLSDYHKDLGKRRPDVAHVMEVYDAMHDEQEERKPAIKESGDASCSDSSSDSNSSDDEEEEAEGKKSEKLQSDGKRDIVSDLKEYKHHHKTLARKNKGLMQWKVARTGNWLKNKVEGGVTGVTQHTFRHHDREPKIETEA